MACLGVCAMLAGCAQEDILARKTFVVELGEDVYANPALYLDDPDKATRSMSVSSRTPGIAINKNRFVTNNQDYLVVGEYDFVLTDRSKEYPFTLKVKDTQPPTLSSRPDRVQAYPGEQIDWASVFQASDLSGVYYDAPGGYSDNYGENEVDVVIKDRFGNSTSQHIIVEVS